MTWTSQNMTVANLVQNLNRKLYNIDPVHQRGIIHDTEWKSDLIDSIFTIGVIPPTFWHKRYGRYESLDGKQRIHTLWEFKGKYGQAGSFRYKGKYYQDLSSEQKRIFNEFTIIFIYTNNTLNGDQIRELFCKFQIVKKTTSGELINSITENPLTALIRDTITSNTTMMSKLTIPESDNNNPRSLDEVEKKGKMRTVRHEHTDTLFQVFYVYLYGDNHVAPQDIMKFFDKELKSLSPDVIQCEFQNAMKALQQILDALTVATRINPNLTNLRQFRYTKTFLCPFIIFLKNDPTMSANKIVFIRNNLEEVISNSKWKVYTKYSTRNRAKFLQECFEISQGILPQTSIEIPNLSNDVQ